MINTIIFRCIFSVACIMALSAWPAWAQYGGMGGGMGGGMSGGRRGMSPERGTRPPANALAERSDSSWVDQVDLHLTELQLELKLSREQAPAWQLFAQALNQYADELRRPTLPVVATAMPSGMGTIRQAVDGVRNRYGLLEDLEGQARALYAVLEPAQKVQFDARVSQWRFLQGRMD
jgi:hypothetical protein